LFESLLKGFSLVIQWPSIGYLILGVFIGLWLGAVPGLGGIIGLVILLPFTFGMDPVPALALLLGMFAITSTSDTIASVMLGIPGTAASQATILDGYPLAKKGEAARAFGAAFTVSAFGGVLGALILAVSLSVIGPFIFSFRSPEFFMLGVLGLATIGSVSGNSIVKGLAIAALGLGIATIGYGPMGSEARYWCGSTYLLDGLPLIPIVLGLFAIPELMELAIKDTSIVRTQKADVKASGILEGVKDAFRCWWLVLRCSTIGLYIGMLPGVGAAIVDWIAYGHAVQIGPKKGECAFGEGNIRGVIAPESANNAAKPGALIPTVAFGIPGSLPTSILLGAFIILGLRPGPDMLGPNLHVTFSMVWDIVIANIVAALLLMLWAKQVSKIAFIRGHLIVPGAILFVLMGAWLGGASLGDWITCLIMGLVGYTMKKAGWPRPPLILAVILGPIMENSFHISVRANQGYTWFYDRPITLVVEAVTIISLILASAGVFKRRKSSNLDMGGSSSQAQSEGGEQNPLLSIIIATVLIVLFVLAGWVAQQWAHEDRLFPIIVSVITVILASLALFKDVRGSRILIRETGSLMASIKSAAIKAELSKALTFFGYLLGTLILTLFIGQMIALPVFIALYLWRWGKYGWKMSIGYALCGWIVLFGFYDRVMHILWHKSWLLS
jgi:TctA family transporter